MAQVIRGTVTDAGTGAVIRGVNIRLLSQTRRPVYGVVSDPKGNFEIVVPSTRAIFVAADLIGYESVTSRALELKPGELLLIDVHLSPRAIPLRGVDVVAHKWVDPRLREFVQRAALNKRAGVGRIWTRADLEKRPLSFVSHLLRTIPVRPTVGCSGTRIFVDDLPILGEMPDADIDLLVAPEDLEGVEVYRDTEIPPDFFARTHTPLGDSPCLLVLLWRKSYAETGQPFSWQRVFAAIGFIGFTVLSSVLVR